MLLQILFPVRCPYCSKVIDSSQPSCRDCREIARPINYRKVLESGYMCVSAFQHEDVWRHSVLQYKFYGCRQFYIPFAKTMAELIKNELTDFSSYFVTSVPMHRRRKSERGFDQVELLGKETARLLKIKYKQCLKQTVLSNHEQHSLTRSERIDNVKGLYRCAKPKYVCGRKIILFDDITTTGSTLTECSAILHKYGAEDVLCVTLTVS